MASTPNGSMIDEITDAGEDGSPSQGLKKGITGKNPQPPHPLEDIAVIETEVVVRTHMGYIIQIFWDPPTP